MKKILLLILITGFMILAAACGAKEAVVPESAEPDTPALEMAEPEPVAEPTEGAMEPVAEEPAEEVTPTPEPRSAVTPAPAQEPTPEPAPTPPPVAEVVADAAERIEVAATKEGLTRIGDAKCKVCHKIQHASWAESSHAGLDPALDCESCHGPGSEYKKMSIMKNRDQAIAAGMVLPEAGFCKNCHTDDWDDGMLEAVHEHKPAS